MAISVGDIIVRFGADLSGLVAGVGAAEASLGVFSAKGAATVAGFAAAGIAAVVGFGVASVKMAADYQQSMNMVQALTGATNQQMAQFDAGIKQLSVDVGIAPIELTKGLYNVISAGFQGAGAMKVLTLAAEDSKIGMTDMTTSTNALTNVLNTFHMTAADATRVNGEMLTTVTLGKSTFADYATYIVKAASTSKQFGVSMETMNAAWATMTSSGISARQATTDYDQSITSMYQKIGTVTTSLHKAGIAFDENKFNAMSYGDKVIYLNQALEQARAKHVAVTGVTVQAAQAIQTIADHISTYQKDLATLSDKQAMSQKTAQAWAITQQGLNVQMGKLHAAVDILMINLGTMLLPTITKIVAALVPLVKGFADWVMQGDNFRLVMVIVSAVLLGLIAVLIAATVALWAFIAPVIVAALPFIALGLIVTAVSGLIMLAIMNWGAITKWLQGIWQAFTSWFMGALGAIGAFFTSIWNGLKSAAISIWNGMINGIESIVKGAVTNLIGWWNFAVASIVLAFQWLYNHNYYFKNLVDNIVSEFNFVKNTLVTIWNFISSWLVGTWNIIRNNAVTAWNAIVQAVTSAWNNVLNFLRPIWAAIVTGVQNAWNAVVAAFQGIWGRVSGPLNTFNGNLGSFLGGIANNARTWGWNIIVGIVNGIYSAANVLYGAVNWVARTIASMLGFHSPPDLGPAADADTWGPNFVKGFSQGIINSLPVLQNALNTLAMPMASLGIGGTTTGAAAGSGAGATHVHIYLDGREVSASLAKNMVTSIRSTGPVGRIA